MTWLEPARDLDRSARRLSGAPHRRAVLVGLPAVGGLVALGACQTPARPNTIRIADAAGNLILTLLEVMRRQRFMESVGLRAEVQPVADGARILGGIVGGSVDGSFISGFGQVFPAIARGADLKVIGGAILTPALALFTGKPGIASLRDLEGKTVGSGSVGALTYQLTVALLRKNGVDVSKVKFVNVGSSADVYRAVAMGSIDAGVGSVSQAASGPTAHVRILPHGDMSTELSQFTYAGAWTSGRAITSQRDTLVKALAAHAKLYRFVQQPSSKDAFLSARRAVLPSASAEDSESEWRFIQEQKPFAVDLTLGRDRLDYIQSLNVEFGVQASVLPFERVADMSLAADALKLLG